VDNWLDLASGGRLPLLLPEGASNI